MVLCQLTLGVASVAVEASHGYLPRATEQTSTIHLAASTTLDFGSLCTLLKKPMILATEPFLHLGV